MLISVYYERKEMKKMDKARHIRTNLKVFRVKQGLSQEKMAQRIGVIRPTYSAIENAKRTGRHAFWDDLQTAFGLTDEEIQELMQID